MFQVDISLGSIPAQEQRVSQALKQPVEAAQKYVQTQKGVNLDETGWHEFTKNVWLWVCSTPSVTVFRIFQGRGGSGAEELLGDHYAGTVGSDRYSAYNWLDPRFRQVCWVHLKLGQPLSAHCQLYQSKLIKGHGLMECYTILVSQR